MTTYAALSNRIRTAETRQDLAKREEQITRHYNAGTITAAASKAANFILGKTNSEASPSPGKVPPLADKNKLSCK